MAETWWGSVIGTVMGEPVARLQSMIDHLAAQDVDGTVEVVLAAPASDRAALEALRPSGAVGRIVAVDNPGGARSPGLNRAACAATAPFVYRIDARSRPPADYLRRCHERLADAPDIGVVGGRQRPVPGGIGVMARGVARALGNPWVLGAPAYRRRNVGGPADTVYLGAFRRDELLEIGGYDERLDANEDYDLCQRYRRAGRLVWLEQALVVDYEARATIRLVWDQYATFGRAKVRYWRLTADRPNGRQLVGLIGPPAVLVGGAFLAIHPRRAILAAVATGAALLAADGLGAEDAAPLPVRAMAALGSVVIPSAWAAGAYAEFLRR